MGEEAGGAAVLGDGEQDVVKSVLAFLAPGEGVTDLLFVVFVGGGGLGEDGVELLWWDVGVVADGFGDLSVVGAFIVKGDAAFLDEPEVGAAPGEASVVGVVHEALVESFEGLAAGEGEVEVAELADAVLGVDDEVGGEAIEDFILGGCDYDVSGQRGTRERGLLQFEGHGVF